MLMSSRFNLSQKLIGRVLAVLCLVVAAAGCKSQARLPDTVPVRGKVVFRGGAPLTGGMIQFQSQERPDVMASSVIAPDGSFELSSFMSGARAPGAVPGQHRVIIVPPFDESNRHSPAIPPQDVTVSAGKNDLTIAIELQVPKRTRPGAIP